MLLDAPARVRLRELAPAFAFLQGAGIAELDALVDRDGGTGAVPLRLCRPGGIGYYENLQLRLLWKGLDGEHVPGALARPGFDGAWTLTRTGSVMSLGILGEALNPVPPEAPVPLESAAFILLVTEPEDVYGDIVLSLVALERRFPGKVVLHLVR